MSATSYIYDANTGYLYSFTIEGDSVNGFSPVFTRVEGVTPPAATVEFAAFAKRVLGKIGVCDALVSPEIQEIQIVQDAYDGIYQTLKDDGLVSWSADDSIPVRFVLPLIDLVAAQVKPIYGKSLTIMENLPILEQPAVKTIRRQMAAPYVPEETQSEYF